MFTYGLAVPMKVELMEQGVFMSCDLGRWYVRRVRQRGVTWPTLDRTNDGGLTVFSVRSYRVRLYYAHTELRGLFVRMLSSAITEVRDNIVSRGNDDRGVSWDLPRITRSLLFVVVVTQRIILTISLKGSCLSYCLTRPERSRANSCQHTFRKTVGLQQGVVNYYLVPYRAKERSCL